MSKPESTAEMAREAQLEIGRINNVISNLEQETSKTQQHSLNYTLKDLYERLDKVYGTVGSLTYVIERQKELLKENSEDDLVAELMAVLEDIANPANSQDMHGMALMAETAIEKAKEVLR